MTTANSAETIFQESGEPIQQFHCPVCSFGPNDAEEVLFHIILTHRVEG